MGLNLVYDIDGVATLDDKPIQPGIYQIWWNGRLMETMIHVVVEKRFKKKTRRAYFELEDDTKVDLVEERVKVEVPGALHRIPGEGAWHGGSGGGTEC